SLTTEVTKTRSPQTTGDDQPRPGISVRQATFFVVLHESGSFLPSATGPAEPPRNCGQLSSARTTGAQNNSPSTLNLRRMQTIPSEMGHGGTRKTRRKQKSDNSLPSSPCLPCPSVSNIKAAGSS